MTNPGKKDDHQMPLSIPEAAAERSRPQSGVGASTPRPRYDRPAAVRIASAALIEKMTGIAPITLIAMYLKMIRDGFAPAEQVPPYVQIRSCSVRRRRLRLRFCGLDGRRVGLEGRRGDR